MNRGTTQNLVRLGAGAAGAWAVARAIRSRNRISFRERVVLISGGSRGLGLVVARRLAAEGARLVLLARTPADLDSARLELGAEHGAEILTVPCDIRDRDAVDSAVAAALGRFGRVDALLHVAGVIKFGPLQHQTEEDFRESLGVHFWGAYYLTEALRRYLPRDGTGRIAYVSSFGGRVAAPHMAAYAAGKAALVAYADAVRTELAREGIRVTTITPGLMRTGSHVNAEFKGRHEDEYAWFSVLDANPLVSAGAESAARQVVDALRHGDSALTITARARMLAALDGLAPGLVGAAMKAANRLLPEPTGPSGDASRTGWESFSERSPSNWTRLADAAVAENNELRGNAPPVG